MEPRVAVLEADMKDVKAGIGRLEIAWARTDARMEIFATAADLGRVASDVSALTERLHAHGETLDDVKTALRELGNKVDADIRGLGSRIDAKMISGGQMFAIFGGLLGLFFVFGGIAISILQHLGLLH